MNAAKPGTVPPCSNQFQLTATSSREQQPVPANSNQCCCRSGSPGLRRPSEPIDDRAEDERDHASEKVLQRRARQEYERQQECEQWDRRATREPNRVRPVAEFAAKEGHRGS